MSLRDELRTLWTAAKLGWAIESNWTDPFLFVIYSIARPVASALILVFMYIVIAGGNPQGQIVAFLVVGNAFWAFVTNGLQGLSWGVIDDRERYTMLKYIYIAPVRFYTYVLGRGSAQLASATAAMLITLIVGVVFLGVPIHPQQIDYPLLLAANALGLASIAMIGLAVAGATLNISREAWGLSEGVAGTFLLLSGAIFPIAVLPDWLEPLARAVPLTYWLEATRRALYGTTSQLSLTDLATSDVLLYLLLTTAAWAVAGSAVFRYAEHRAKERGLLDMVTGY